MGTRGSIWFVVALCFWLVTLLLMAVATVATVTHQHQRVIVLMAAAGVCFVVGHALRMVDDKKSRARMDRLSEVIQNADIIPARPDDYPWLDVETFDRWTSELADLGFTRLGNYTVGWEGMGARELDMPGGFTRLMANEQHRCFAQVHQTYRAKPDPFANLVSRLVLGRTLKMKSGPTDPTCSLLTLFTSGQEAHTSNATIPPELIPRLQEFGAAPALAPGASPTELLRLHLEQREKLISEQGLVTLDDLSFGAYRLYQTRKKDQGMAQNERRMAEIKERYGRI